MTAMTVTGWVPDPSHDFGARLALVRQHQAWNIREAARECEIDPESWRAWETLGRKPRDFESIAHRISLSSGCSIVWLMTGQTGRLPGGGSWGDRDSNPEPDGMRTRVYPFPAPRAALHAA